MAHRYFPHTEEDVERMLDTCGVKTIETLYSDVPSTLLFGKDYDLPSEMSEAQVRKFFNRIFSKNKKFDVNLSGGGYYFHEIPSVIPTLISRSEFLTAYTPYQPEISQGTLQYIFEYQTLMSRLTGLDISNASLYDGSTATAEAMILAVSNARKKNRVLITDALNPDTKKVVETYARYRNIEIKYIPLTSGGVTNVQSISEELKAGDVAAVIMATPNYYGILEDMSGLADICHSNKALLIINCVAADLASIKSPGEWGADIAVGDAQSLGIPVNAGGPYLGFICCGKSLMRKIPGRIVGMTKDSEGRRAFVLTLQAREQHIRREKATSNICSNQGLMALYVTIYMSLLGLKGLKEINSIGIDGAHYLADMIVKSGKACLKYPDASFFNEFLISFPNSEKRDKFFDICMHNGILPGIKVEKTELLIAVTETTEKDSLDKLIELLKNN